MSTRTSKRRRKFGVIDETHLSFTSPRMCDDVRDLLEDAFEAAFLQIDMGAEEVAIVNAEYNEKDDCWYEVVDGWGIYIDASNWEFEEENEED